VRGLRRARGRRDAPAPALRRPTGAGLTRARTSAEPEPPKSSNGSRPPAPPHRYAAGRWPPRARAAPALSATACRTAASGFTVIPKLRRVRVPRIAATGIGPPAAADLRAVAGLRAMIGSYAGAARQALERGDQAAAARRFDVVTRRHRGEAASARTLARLLSQWRGPAAGYEIAWEDAAREARLPARGPGAVPRRGGRARGLRGPPRGAPARRRSRRCARSARGASRRRAPRRSRRGTPRRAARR
jgi:hypothetical protein